MELTTDWRIIDRVPHVFDVAPTGRAKCRGCGQALPKGELRFGERLPNAYGEGEMTLWFHPRCAAFKRPEPLTEALTETTESVPDREDLERVSRGASAFRRLPRVDGAERAPSGKAKCRCCHNAIERGTWRVRLVFYEDGRFSPGGFLHLACHPTYFEGHDALDAILHFTPGMDVGVREELKRAYQDAAARPSAPAPPQAAPEA
jgi:hypothetical protein